MDGILEYPLASSDEMAAEAWAAMARQDADEALRLWARLRQHFPERPDGHVWPIQVLWQGGRLEEAERAAAEAAARFPDHPDLLVQLAWIAMLHQHWSEALQWWAAARTRAPERPDGYIWAAHALRQLGRLDEAEAMAVAARERFPDNVDALAECAWVAAARRDWEEALGRWMRVHEPQPERLDARIGVIQALRMVGRVDEAETLATEALTRLPDHADLLIEHVWVAVSRDDWSAAAARLAAARDKLQGSGRFEESLGWVEHQLRFRTASTAEAAALPSVSVAASAPDEISTPDLMRTFESLGERCDFGAVQRRFGVEPLGLLRFAFSRLDPLIEALDDRFQAVGTVEDTGFELYNDENILYMKKYGIVFHTFVSQKELPTQKKRDEFRRQQRRRLVFLRDKLVADLEDPQKIYVYATEERASDTDVARLFGALCAYGANSLLYVRPASGNRPEGTVEVLEDGLYAGYFPRLADFLAGEQPPFELWRRMCERTYRLAKATDRFANKIP
ncbi:MAG TPA: tetratricopeptide repeat protein [Stellaceae bacterium]|nr:tetratricopeptide repeat protein [Stellaceae bacterium]